MVMLTLRGLLDYYKDEITFNQIMNLYKSGKISLKGGIASVSDLRIICEECDLHSVDARKLEPEQADAESGIEQKLQEMLPSSIPNFINSLEKNIYNLRKEIGKKNNLTDDKCWQLVQNHVRLAEAYELLHRRDNDNDALEKAADNRKHAEELYSSAENTKEKRQRADNLLRLGEIVIKSDKRECAEYFITAANIYEEILNTIRNSESRMKSEDNAKVAAANFHIYEATGEVRYLKKAEQMLESYEPFDSKKKYSAMLDEIRIKFEEMKKNGD